MSCDILIWYHYKMILPGFWCIMIVKRHVTTTWLTSWEVKYLMNKEFIYKMLYDDYKKHIPAEHFCNKKWPPNRACSGGNSVPSAFQDVAIQVLAFAIKQAEENCRLKPKQLETKHLNTFDTNVLLERTTQHHPASLLSPSLTCENWFSTTSAFKAVRSFEDCSSFEGLESPKSKESWQSDSIFREDNFLWGFGLFSGANRGSSLLPSVGDFQISSDFQSTMFTKFFS